MFDNNKSFRISCDDDMVCKDVKKGVECLGRESLELLIVKYANLEVIM